MPVVVAGALEESLKSVAVTVFVPVALRMRLNSREPASSVVLAGSVAWRSLEVIATVSVIVLTVFQLSSAAFTVTLKGVSGDWIDGVPVLPLRVPGAALSPGARINNLVKAPALTVTVE